MNIQKLTLLLLIVFFLFSCSKNAELEGKNIDNSLSQTNINQDAQYFSDILFSGNSEDIEKNFSHLASSEDLNELQKTLQSSDFAGTQKVIEKITSQIKKETLLPEDKQKVKSLVNVYLSAVLNE